mmetsp:Transcript_46397/g.55841  ORF Transcript_46397/g.55841 Transcript_46397/m.55841 type:complete len:109 (-) Transcript_46397:40-366(-)
MGILKILTVVWTHPDVEICSLGCKTKIKRFISSPSNTVGNGRMTFECTFLAAEVSMLRGLCALPLARVNENMDGGGGGMNPGGMPPSGPPAGGPPPISPPARGTLALL